MSTNSTTLRHHIGKKMSEEIYMDWLSVASYTMPHGVQVQTVMRSHNDEFIICLAVFLVPSLLFTTVSVSSRRDVLFHIALLPCCLSSCFL